jgi:hypothetical protein
VVNHDDEAERYFGSELHTQYLMTETWQFIGGDWKLRQVHCAAVSIDAPTIKLSRAQMDELVRKYIAGSLTYVISRHDDHLLGAQPGHQAGELKGETRDVLIVINQPRSKKVFLRDGAGKIISFADRREYCDLTWTRRW